jgi:hypothetical protein
MIGRAGAPSAPLNAATFSWACEMLASLRE